MLWFWPSGSTAWCEHIASCVCCSLPAVSCCLASQQLLQHAHVVFLHLLTYTLLQLLFHSTALTVMLQPSLVSNTPHTIYPPVHVVGFYISPAFLDKITIHVAKNFMDLPKIKVPLILGIWGGKGQGKTFQCALAFKKLGISPIVMSAGELESGNAGEPAKLIRQRYR